MDHLDMKLNQVFPNKVVRKDVTELLKKTASAPAFVIEYLVGMYCTSTDEKEIQKGIEKVKSILSMNFVRPNETEKVKFNIVESQYKGHVIIDRLFVGFDEENAVYLAFFENFRVDPLEISPEYVRRYEKLLTDGVWGLIKVKYEDNKFFIVDFSPIQMANFDIGEVFANRKLFSVDEWVDVLLRSIGYEASSMDMDAKLSVLTRLVPLIEKNYNLVELGPRGTGKSHIYKEISPYAILMSGGKTTVANMFINMRTGKVGLVGNWDCITFDEIGGMEYKNPDLIQMLKDYMSSGSFARGTASIPAAASVVYIGNIDNGSDFGYVGRKLFEPFPKSFNHDAAFFDRMHFYIAGWKVPKMSRTMITDKYGLITDYFSEFCKEMRKYDRGDEFDRYFTLNKSCNIRDEKAIRKTFSGLAKLLFPDMDLDEDSCRWLLDWCISGRKRIKVQLAEMAEEFQDIDLGYDRVYSGGMTYGSF